MSDLAKGVALEYLEEVRAWLRGHGIDPADVPVNGGITEKPDGGYVIKLIRRDANRRHVRVDGVAPVYDTVERPADPPAPWRKRSSD